MLREWTKAAATIATIGLVAACAQQSEVGTTIEPGEAGQEAVEDTAGVPETANLPMTWQAMATGETNVEAEIAIRDEEAGGTFASVALDGEADHAYPWHIHEGECGSGGAIVGDGDSYGVIATDAEGEGRATADLGVELSPDADYYVNIHASPEDLGTIVACGEVESQ